MSVAKAMLHEKTSRRKAKKNTTGWGGFVNCEMGSAERKEFKLFAQDLKAHVTDLMLEMLDADISLSMSYSDKDEAYLAKATQTNEEDGNRYMLSAFHGDVETAWQLLYWKHKVLLDCNWFSRPSEADDEDNWG